MDGTVIVALPSVDDRVNKISSEQKAHLTLLFLGDQSDNVSQLPGMVEFVQHAAENLNPFGLTVDYRGKLGVDDADVLFFEDKYAQLDEIRQFRTNLLGYAPIRSAYDSVDQFPLWTPHLTLGYPETPAHEDDSDYPGIHHISFDRIAVWVGDFQGPEFRLKYKDSGMEVAMSDMEAIRVGEAAVKELFHYGVKGMQWGVTSVDKAGSVTKTQDVPAKKGAKDVTVTQKRAGDYVKSKGGERKPATDEAIKAQAGRQTAKKSTTDALTNAELKATVERMQLEQQFIKLSKQSARQSRGQRFIEALLSVKKDFEAAKPKDNNKQ